MEFSQLFQGSNTWIFGDVRDLALKPSPDFILIDVAPSSSSADLISPKCWGYLDSGPNLVHVGLLIRFAQLYPRLHLVTSRAAPISREQLSPLPPSQPQCKWQRSFLHFHSIKKQKPQEEHYNFQWNRLPSHLFFFFFFNISFVWHVHLYFPKWRLLLTTS